MARRRFFVDTIRQSRAVLSGEDARHLTKVLRVEAGQQFEISDNESVYLAEVDEVGRDQVSFRVLEEVAAHVSPVRITLLAALIKFDRFEWMLEKATELGVEIVIPVHSERSEKGLDKAGEKRMERWRKIVRESAQQARRAQLPEVRNPVPFKSALLTPSAYRLFLEEKAGAPPILSRLPEVRSQGEHIAVLIGPEGGWTESERQEAAAGGWEPVSLGSNILRAETAAIAALAILTNAWLK